MPIKNYHAVLSKGFTLIEMLVVITIMGILMTMAASVLDDVGKGRTVEAAVAELEGMLQEAQSTARGNDTPTRVVIIDKPEDTTRNSKHLRYAIVMMLSKKEKSDGKYDGTDVSTEGRWKSVSNGRMFPDGVFFSPTYSKPLEWAEQGDEEMLGHDMMTIAGLGPVSVYYIEFDERGRFVAPLADPLNPTAPQRLVVMKGRRASGKKYPDGITPSDLDSKNRPVGAKGVVLWPSGDTSRLRTVDQIQEEKAAVKNKRNRERDRDRRERRQQNSRDRD